MIAVAAFTVGMLLTAYNYEASGQVNSTSSKNTSTAKIPSNQPNAPKNINITGSIPLRPTIKSAISSKVKTTLNEAVLTAQKAVGSNSSATLALARPLNGYLVYDIHVRDDNNNTSHAVIVDPGTGKVLYKQTSCSWRSTKYSCNSSREVSTNYKATPDNCGPFDKASSYRPCKRSN